MARYAAPSRQEIASNTSKPGDFVRVGDGPAVADGITVGFSEGTIVGTSVGVARPGTGVAVTASGNPVAEYVGAGGTGVGVTDRGAGVAVAFGTGVAVAFGAGVGETVALGVGVGVIEALGAGVTVEFGIGVGVTVLTGKLILTLGIW